MTTLQAVTMCAPDTRSPSTSPLPGVWSGSKEATHARVEAGAGQGGLDHTSRQ